MESLTSVQSSDSDNSLLSYSYNNRNNGSSSSLLALQSKHLSPTNILKFSKYISNFYKLIV